jgi:membrane-bound lytic murein transglycosylase D
MTKAMKKRIFVGLMWLCATAVGAQTSPDSLAVAEDSLAIAATEVPLLDTIPFVLVPASIDYIPADETPALLKDRLGCIEQIIPLTYNDKVHAFINYFTIRDREYTRMVQRRKNLYFPMFEKYLDKHQLPDELKYLSIIESGLNPRAISRARAVGLWQFMSGTGRYFGLRSDGYTDDRMDPEKSTEAACLYLKQLYSLFGDWQLALAAYNSGPGTVRKAIRRSGYKKSFWEVYPFLPRETRAYVPQFIAITYAMNYTAEHNLIETAQEELPPYDTLHVQQVMHFGTLAKLTGTCQEDLQKLNPSVQFGALPDNGRTYVIKIPQQAKEKLQTNRKRWMDSIAVVGKKEIASMSKTMSGSTYGRNMTIYTVRSGDVLGSIAQRNGVKVDDIRHWNNLRSNLIHPGQRLIVWSTSSKAPTTIVSASSKKTPVSISPDATTYVVQPGDTLWDISRLKPGLTIERLKALNNLKSNKLQPGQKLILG